MSKEVIDRCAELEVIKQEAHDYEVALDDLHARLNQVLKGVPITVTHETWNGQQYGRSWPKLKGKTFPIDHAIIHNGSISVWFDGPQHYCYMPISYGDLAL